jgi:hypothetical protein
MLCVGNFKGVNFLMAEVGNFFRNCNRSNDYDEWNQLINGLMFCFFVVNFFNGRGG